MHKRIASSRFGLVALSALAALSILATSADAGNGRGYKKHKHRGHDCSDVCYVERWREPRHVVVARPARRVYAAPVYAACAPRYVSYRSPRAIVVRPAPYVRVGARIGSVDIGAVFGGRSQYSNYEYGCNFCESRYSSFSAYDSHVQSCSYRPRNVQIQARVWDDAGYGEWEGRDASSQDRRYSDSRYEEDDRYDRRYDDDDRYDRRYDDDDYDD